MKEHLAYREENKEKLQGFFPTKALGARKKVYIDESAGTFIVTTADPGKWFDENPDIIPLATVMNCAFDIKEDRDEIYMKDSQGNNVSYNPKRYRYTYDFYITINVNNRWFDEIKFQLNGHEVEGMGSLEYRGFEMAGNEIRNALMGAHMPQQPQQTYAQPQQGYAPQQPGAVYPNGYPQQAQQAYAQQPQGFPYQAQGIAAAQGIAQQQGYVQQHQQGYAPQQPQQGYVPQQPQQAPQAQPAQWFCPNCGAANTSKFCQNCGTPNPRQG